MIELTDWGNLDMPHKKLIETKDTRDRVDKDLVSAATLWEDVGYSLDERCEIYNKKYPKANLPTSYLSRLYQRHNVRKKKLDTHKSPTLIALELAKE